MRGKRKSVADSSPSRGRSPARSGASNAHSKTGGSTRGSAASRGSFRGSSRGSFRGSSRGSASRGRGGMHRDRKSREERAEQNGIVIPEEDRLKEQVNAGVVKQFASLKRRTTKHVLNAKEVRDDNLDSTILLSETPGLMQADDDERIQDITQQEMVPLLNLQTASKMFDLDLDSGPYSLSYTSNGRHLALAGRRGHIAILDWVDKSLKAEFSVSETVRDIAFLHNEMMFAVAQRKYVYIYDQSGTQLHLLSKESEPAQLEFLRYHFLLSSLSIHGDLTWEDISLGTVAGKTKAKGGVCMRQNPYNAVMCVGQNNGVVTMWSPVSKTPLAEIRAHSTRVNALAVDRSGINLVTSGMDGRLSVWDVRKFDKTLNTRYVPPPTSIDISQKGIIACGYLHYVKMFNLNSYAQQDQTVVKQFDPYMAHEAKAKNHVSKIRFVPYEDVLGLGHAGGFSSIVVPGSGDPNYDNSEDNPFQNSKQRANAEVKSLLEKLQPDMIMLDPDVIARVVRPKKYKTVEEAEYDALHPATKIRLADAQVIKEKKNKKIGSKMKGQADRFDQHVRKKIAEQQQSGPEDELEDIIEDDGKPATVLDRFNRRAKKFKGE